MKWIIRLFSLSILTLLFASCAKQSSPTGGPRDETPPVLLESDPKDQSLNTKPEQIKLTFDEYVTLENASKGVVITPRINKDLVEFSALKNTVVVKLNQELEDSTTYAFDFQKAVVDLSEKNPAENLKIVFSTGNSIDSLSIAGKINYYYPENKEDYKNVLVGLYPVDDTTDVFTAQPYYLGQVDTLGNFKITNIKNGKYRAYAWRDTNGSLKAEFKSEEHDFLLDSIELTENMENLQFNLSKADLTPIKILRSSSFGQNYDVILNRNPVETKISNEDLGREFFYINSDKRIRIYPKSQKTDSIPFKLTLTDSVGFSTDSLIWAKFQSSERKPEKVEITPNSGKSFYQNLDIELKFNKPILSIKMDSLYIQYDSASFIPIKEEMISFTDSAKRDILKIKLFVADSISKEIFTLKASDSTFTDIEGLVNEKGLSANYRKLKREGLADEIKGKIEGAKAPYILQLLDNKGEVNKEIYIENGDTYSLKLIEPGTYKIRVIEDLNGNKRWDSSNYVQKRLAERVFYYQGEENKNEIIVRGGWTLEDQNIKANPPTGLPIKE